MLRVDCERLVAAAVDVTSRGEDLAARHLAADNRIEAAAPGWAGRSAAALRDRTSRWVSASTLLVARVGEHATDLHTGALRFSAMDTMNAGHCAHRITEFANYRCDRSSRPYPDRHGTCTT